LKVKGLDGREHSWSLVSSPSEHCSQLHERARTVLNNIFPFDRIYEEVNLPGSAVKGRNSTLTADFYIPTRHIMIEVNGIQHTEYTHFFHKNKMAFFKGKARDVSKKRWCELNDVTLIYFDYKESDEEWKLKI
jgi:hypothetical protein